MRSRRRLLIVLSLTGLILLAACTDTSPPNGSESGTPAASESSSQRLDVYETLVRHLTDPRGDQPIYVLSDLCFMLMKSEPGCPERLSREELRELTARLQDLGEIVFGQDGDQLPQGSFQEILLGPIVTGSDGLRVEGGSLCGV